MVSLIRSLALLLTLCLTSSTVAMPVQWRLADGGNAHAYRHVIPPGGITWTDAEAAAQANFLAGVSGHLVTINSQAEWDFVVSEFPINYTWIGLTDQFQEGNFYWVTGEPVTFTRWIPNEPNNAGDEDFVFYQTSSGLGGDFGWNDFKNSRNVYSSQVPLILEDLSMVDADANMDGHIDGTDYLLWAAAYGDNPAADPPGPPLNGDFNYDDVVDGLDYLVWASNYGMGPLDAVAVPEPGALVLLCVGVAFTAHLLALARRRGHTAAGAIVA